MRRYPVSRRAFVRTAAAGLLVPAAVQAGLITAAGSRYAPSGGSSVTFQSGWSGSGTFDDGEIVTLSYGAGGLSIPSDPRPDFWMPLESDISKDPTYSKDTTALSYQTNASIQTSVKPTNSAGALAQLFSASPSGGTQPGASPGNPSHNFFSNSPIANVNQSCYAWCKRYRDYDGSGLNGKNWRIWRSDNTTTDTYIKDGFNNAATTEGSAYDNYQQHGGVTPFFSWPFPTNVWWTEEFIFQESTLNTLDGLVDSTRNGGWAFGASNRAFITKSTGYDYNKVNFFPSQYSNPGSTGPANGAYEYLSGLYFNGSNRFRVIVSTESTYNTSPCGSTDLGVNREIQLPVQDSGSAFGVQVKLRKGAYAALAGSGLYMYLIEPNETAHKVLQFT